MNAALKKVGKHKDSFEEIYKNLPKLYDISFPLAEIDYFDWHRGEFANSYYSYHYRRFTTHIYSLLDLADNQKVLIIGCGFGFDEKNIKMLFPNTSIWSIDISEEMIKRAKNSKSPSSFSLAMAEKLPFPDNCFDRILAREVIEHVISPNLMLKNMERVLKNNGIAVVTTENEESYGPTNYYDQVIRPRLYKLFSGRFPEISYKDEAPTFNEIIMLAKKSKLTLIDTVYDGALYKYLIEMNTMLKNILVKVAHYFSCLENRSKIAFWFCDQVKYKFTKRDSFQDKIFREVLYVCPSDYGELISVIEGYQCKVCGKTYKSTDNLINFTDSDIDTVVESKNKNIQESSKSKPFFEKFKRRALMVIDKLFRKFYTIVYILLALFFTIICRKNDDTNSIHVNAIFEKYLKKPS